MSNATDHLEKMLHKVDLIPYVHGPSNLVVVTTDDVIEIFHQLAPYTMQKLDEVTSHD